MKLSNLRRAMEEATVADEPVLLKGSLSDAFTQSLVQVYKKPEEQDAVAIESQANDVIAMQKLAQAINNEINPQADNTPATVFAVAAGQVTDQDVITLTQDMIDQDSKNNPDYAVVLDTTTPETQAGLGDQTVQFVELDPLSTALESIAKAHGVPVYRSLEAYAIARYIH